MGVIDLLRAEHAAWWKLGAPCGLLEQEIKDASEIRISRAADVLDPDTIEMIRNVINPQQKECYKNATDLTLLDARFKYCEGVMDCHFGFPIDHAFNKFGEHHIDITIEFALNHDPTEYDYAVFAEYDQRTTQSQTLENGVYGELYKTEIRKQKSRRKTQKTDGTMEKSN